MLLMRWAARSPEGVPVFWADRPTETSRNVCVCRLEAEVGRGDDATQALCALGASRLAGRSAALFVVESFSVVLSTIWPARTFTV